MSEKNTQKAPGPKGIGTLTVEQIQEDRITQVVKLSQYKMNNCFSEK